MKKNHLLETNTKYLVCEIYNLEVRNKIISFVGLSHLMILSLLMNA